MLITQRVIHGGGVAVGVGIAVIRVKRYAGAIDRFIAGVKVCREGHAVRGLRRDVAGFNLDIRNGTGLQRAAVINRITLQVIAGGIDDIAVFVRHEGTGAGIGDIPGAVAHNKKTIIIDSQIQRITG